MLKILPFLLVFIITGCTSVSAVKTQPITLFIKSKNIKLNDTGFISIYTDRVDLQIYSSGVNIFNLKIKDKICVNGVCKSKGEFNQSFFGSTHYDDILSDILMANPIYNKKHLTKTKCGFRQNFNDILVIYEVCDKKISFEDNKNGLKIAIRGLN